MAESSALRQDRGGQNILLFFVVFLCILYIILSAISQQPAGLPW